MFFLNDLSKSYPHAAVERVSTSWNLVYAGLLPFVLVSLWLLVTRPGIHAAHVTILGLLISHALSSFLTDVVKNAVGRPRPDLIARCKPEKGTPTQAMVTWDVCTETDPHTLQDGWRSFPSGHSSFAFSGLGYLALFFAGQMHVLRPRTDLTRFLIAGAPLLCAALIAISRVEDYRHDVYDVTVGSMVGMAMAYFSYRRYYPSLTSPHCHEPYPNRAGFATQAGGGKMRDEESRIRGATEFSLGDLTEDEAETYPLGEGGERGESHDRGPGPGPDSHHQ